MKLVRFLMRLSNETLTFELKDGTTVTGTLAGMDPHMNAHVRAATLTPGTGPGAGTPVSLRRVLVRGSALRAVLLPDALALGPLLVDDRPRADRHAGPPGAGRPAVRGRGRGRGRAA